MGMEHDYIAESVRIEELGMHLPMLFLAHRQHMPMLHGRHRVRQQMYQYFSSVFSAVNQQKSLIRIYQNKVRQRSDIEMHYDSNPSIILKLIIAAISDYVAVSSRE